MKREIKNAVTM